MKYLLLFLLSLGLKAELDLTIPEQPAAYIPPQKKFLQFIEVKEPPTKAQLITYWTLNVLDVYTTHQGLKKENVYESNPLYSKKPTLEELILGKLVIGTILHNNFEKNELRITNVFLTHAVINNYKIMK
jgi:hypothetical protein